MIEFRVWCALASIACKFCYYFAFFLGTRTNCNWNVNFISSASPFSLSPFSASLDCQVRRSLRWMDECAFHFTLMQINRWMTSLSLIKSDLWADRQRDRQTDKQSKHLHCNFKWTRIALWHIYPIPPSPHLMRSTEVAPKIKIQIPRLKAARNTWLAFSWKALQAVWSELRDFSAKAQGLPTNKDNSSNNRSDNNNNNTERVKPQLEADKMFYKRRWGCWAAAVL